MTDPTRQKDVLWLSAMRAVGYHFSKIGDVISKYAEDSDKLNAHHRSGSTAGPQTYPPVAHSDSAHAPGDDERRWPEEPRVAKPGRTEAREPRDNHTHREHREPRDARAAREPRDIHEYPRAQYTTDRPASTNAAPASHNFVYYHPDYSAPSRSPPPPAAAAAAPTSRRSSDVEPASRTPSHPSADAQHTRRESAPSVLPSGATAPSAHPQGPHFPLDDATAAATQDASAKRKRRGPVSTAELEESVKQTSPRPSLDTTRPSAFKAKSIKRVRINWSPSENTVFFDTIQKFSTEDESTVLKEIVTALKGSRNWVQCKGHFRNLQYVGRISQTEAEPKHWRVVEQSIKSQKGSTGSKPSTSPPGLKNGNAADNGASSPEQKYPHAGAGNLQSQMVDFDTHTTSGATGGVVDKQIDSGDHDRDQMTMHEEEEEDVDEDHEDDYTTHHTALNKENDERVDNNHGVNGHVSRKGVKSLRGMNGQNPRTLNNNNNNNNSEHNHGNNAVTEGYVMNNLSAKDDLSDIADQSVHNMRDVNGVADGVKVFEGRDVVSVPLKKQTSAGLMSMKVPQLRVRENRDKHRYADFRAPSNPPPDVGRFALRK